MVEAVLGAQNLPLTVASSCLQPSAHKRSYNTRQLTRTLSLHQRAHLPTRCASSASRRSYSRLRAQHGQGLPLQLHVAPLHSHPLCCGLLEIKAQAPTGTLSDSPLLWVAEHLVGGGQLHEAVGGSSQHRLVMARAGICLAACSSGGSRSRGGSQRGGCRGRPTPGSSGRRVGVVLLLSLLLLALLLAAGCHGVRVKLLGALCEGAGGSGVEVARVGASSGHCHGWWRG